MQLKVASNNEALNNKIDDNVLNIEERFTNNEQETTGALTSLARDLEKQKQEIMDAVESKFEYINKNIEGTLKTVTSTYDDLSSNL